MQNVCIKLHFYCHLNNINIYSSKQFRSPLLSSLYIFFAFNSNKKEGASEIAQISFIHKQATVAHTQTHDANNSKKNEKNDGRKKEVWKAENFFCSFIGNV